MTNLTGDEQALVRRVGGWMIARYLAWPDGGFDHQGGMGPVDLAGHAGAWIAYDAKGIRLETAECGCPDDGDHADCWPETSVVLQVTRSRLASHARSLLPGLVDRLREHDRLAAQHQRDYPVWHATGIALGCGPLHLTPHEDWTPAMREYAAQHDAWERDLYSPWVKKSRELDAAQDDLLDEALPLARDHEPTDLLELLAAGGA